MTNYIVNDTDLTAIANAIREKTGGTAPLVWPADFTDSIDSISGGTAKRTLARKNVNFYDYDGTLVYSYDKDEFLGLDELPVNPDHSHDEVPLTAEGWNWSLSNAQTFISSYDYLDIGQNYVTTSGKATFVIDIEENTPQNRRTFYLYLSQENSAEINIDWGDGSNIDTNFNTSEIIFQHDYLPGHYIVQIWSTTASSSFYIGTSNGSPVNRVYGSPNNTNFYNRGRIKKFFCSVQIAKIQNYAFSECYNLSTIVLNKQIANYNINQYTFAGCITLRAIVIPENSTQIANSSFNGCTNLHVACLPASITTVTSGAFNDCQSLKSCMITGTNHPASLFSGCLNITNAILPEGTKTIQNKCFRNCSSIFQLVIPSTVTTINSAFSGCYSLSELHVKATTPPTATGTTVLSVLPADCTIYVPYSSDHSILAAYKAATNWSAAADQIIEEPQNENESGGDGK